MTGHANTAVTPLAALRRKSVRRALALAVLLACVAGLSALSLFNRRAAASNPPAVAAQMDKMQQPRDEEKKE